MQDGENSISHFLPPEQNSLSIDSTNTIVRNLLGFARLLKFLQLKADTKRNLISAS
jgi:hypothetical protein